MTHSEAEFQRSMFALVMLLFVGSLFLVNFLGE
jgi:hypothetical protein